MWPQIKQLCRNDLAVWALAVSDVSQTETKRWNAAYQSAEGKTHLCSALLSNSPFHCLETSFLIFWQGYNINNKSHRFIFSSARWWSVWAITVETEPLHMLGILLIDGRSVCTVGSGNKRCRKQDITNTIVLIRIYKRQIISRTSAFSPFIIIIIFIISTIYCTLNPTIPHVFFAPS